jgi:hypothetical protein
MEFQNNENDLGFSFDIDGVEDAGTFEIELKEDAPSSAADAAVKSANTTDGESTEAGDATSDAGTFEVTLKNAISGSEKEGDTTFTLPEDKPSSDSAPSSPHLLTRLASALQKDGVLTGVTEEDIKDVDIPKLAEMIKGTIKQNEYSDLDDRTRQALDVVKHHNAETKLADFTEDRFIESDIDDEAIADTKKNIRQNLIYNDLIARGYSQADAERRTRQSFNSGDDEADAKLALSSLKSIAAQRKQAEIEQAKQTQQQHENSRQDLFKRVAELKEVLPGMPVNEETAKWMAEAMTNPTGRNESGQLRTTVSDKRSEDPFNFDTRLHYFIKMGLFDEKPDLSLFTRRSMSSAVEELEKSLSNEGIYEGGRGASLESITEREMKENYLRMLDGADI